METTRFYQSIVAAFRLLDPDRSGIRSHHDVVGGPSGSGLLDLPPRHLLIAKYIWPNDRMVDYVYASLLKNQLAGEDRRFELSHAVFGEAVSYPEQSLQEAATGLDPVNFCPDRGFLTARDRWDETGMRLDFRCRMDKYHLGHVHSDVNTFELWSHGREWIIDRGKFAGTINDVHSTVLIDGVSSCCSKRNAWPSFPGRFLEYKESKDMVLGAGDAKPFYDFSFGKPQSGKQELVRNHGLTWDNFYLPREGETCPEWMKRTPVDLDGYGNQRGIYRMNPVRRAFRTVAMIRGSHPFVLIADDIEKDGAAHDYMWIANTCTGGEMVKVSGDRENLIIRHRRDVDGGPRLLVRVLEAKGQSGPIDLESTSLFIGKDKVESVRIRIPCEDVVAPDYRVLLFPFEEGDDLPEIRWNASKTELEVSVGRDIFRIDFARGADGRTRISEG